MDVLKISELRKRLCDFIDLRTSCAVRCVCRLLHGNIRSSVLPPLGGMWTNMRLALLHHADTTGVNFSFLVGDGDQDDVRLNHLHRVVQMHGAHKHRLLFRLLYPTVLWQARMPPLCLLRNTICNEDASDVCFLVRDSQTRMLPDAIRMCCGRGNLLMLQTLAFHFSDKIAIMSPTDVYGMMLGCPSIDVVCAFRRSPFNVDLNAVPWRVFRTWDSSIFVTLLCENRDVTCPRHVSARVVRSFVAQLTSRTKTLFRQSRCNEMMPVLLRCPEVMQAFVATPLDGEAIFAVIVSGDVETLLTLFEHGARVVESSKWSRKILWHVCSIHHVSSRFLCSAYMAHTLRDACIRYPMCATGVLERAVCAGARDTVIAFLGHPHYIARHVFRWTRDFLAWIESSASEDQCLLLIAVIHALDSFAAKRRLVLALTRRVVMLLCVLSHRCARQGFMELCNRSLFGVII